MASLAIALPILPGKTDEWKRVVAEVTGPRLSETDDLYRRLGITKANWFLQQRPAGDIGIVYYEADDPVQSFLIGTQSDHPYDRWFKQQFGPLHGIDFNQPPPGLLPEQIFEWQAR